jgi:hypothetical protein
MPFWTNFSEDGNSEYNTEDPDCGQGSGRTDNKETVSFDRR